MHFEAYVHANAIMWKVSHPDPHPRTNPDTYPYPQVAFEELRGLTNKTDLQEKGVGLNPMELNDLYDHLWNLGTLLQGDPPTPHNACAYNNCKRSSYKLR
jgi:hypothetical protein